MVQRNGRQFPWSTICRIYDNRISSKFNIQFVHSYTFTFENKNRLKHVKYKFSNDYDITIEIKYFMIDTSRR